MAPALDIVQDYDDVSSVATGGVIVDCELQSGHATSDRTS